MLTIDQVEELETEFRKQFILSHPGLMLNLSMLVGAVRQLHESLAKTNALGEEMLTRLENATGVETKADHGWYYVVERVECQLRQLLEENERLKDELQCEFCDEPVYDEQDNALTFLVCGRCWNKSQEQLRQTIGGLRNEVTEARKAAEKWYHERY